MFLEVGRQPTAGRVMIRTLQHTGPPVACATLIGDSVDLAPHSTKAGHIFPMP